MEENFDNRRQQATPPPLYGVGDTYTSKNIGQRNYAAMPTSAIFNRVFLWMFGALLVTALTALLVVHTPLYFAIQGAGMWVCIIAELVLVFVLSARIHKMSFTTATIMMVVYSILNGVTLSLIFAVYTMTSIATTFFVTAGMFGVMAFVGFSVKRDLLPLYRYLMMGLIGLILASVIYLIVGGAILNLIISLIGVVLFVILTAVDTNRIKKDLENYNGVLDNESVQKIALMGALSLYLDFINLFLYLLRFIGRVSD